MSKSAKRKLLALTVGGSLFQFNAPSSCAAYYANAGIQAFDFCAVLNCTGGTYFDFCSPFLILIDCPVDTTP